MISFVKRLWAAAPIATLILALALAATGVFTVRAVLFSVRWHDPAQRELAIAGWMTPGFVAHSWHVPPEVVLDAIGAPHRPERGGPITFEQLAEAQGVPLETLAAQADAAIAAFRAAHEPPAPPPPAPDAPAAPSEADQ